MRAWRESPPKDRRKDAPFEEIRGMCRLFQWLLPGLVTNVAYLRAQLAAPTS